MSSSGSVTAWIDQLRAGDRAAAQKLWEDYFQRLVALARQKLRSAPRGMADEEDVALSAFDSFCRGAERGRFPQLADRDDLWRLLFVITERKAIDLVNHENAEKRGGGKVRHEGSLAGGSTVNYAFDHLAAPEPTPKQAAEVAEKLRALLDVLENDRQRAVTVAKLEGCTNEEISKQIKRAVPTVERDLKRIRKIWGKEMSR
jgi:DNA-directed RNA polymerase specialized sigma24 family protein